jgi:hypothetical protein
MVVKTRAGFHRCAFYLCGCILLLANRSPFAQPTLSERKDRIQDIDKDPPKEAIERKRLSESVLIKQNVPISKTLPVIESESDSKRRTVEEIAYRALSLLVVAVKGEGLEQARVLKLAKEYGLDSRFTPKERVFIGIEKPSDRDRVQFIWRYESAWTLLWALGYVDKLDKPVSICDVRKAVAIMKDRTSRRFISDSRLRPLGRILDEADLIYRYHWAVVDARLKGQPAPAGLEPDVIMERHYALNWLIGYMDQEWDDISTDT